MLEAVNRNGGDVAWLPGDNTERVEVPTGTTSQDGAGLEAGKRARTGALVMSGVAVMAEPGEAFRRHIDGEPPIY